MFRDAAALQDFVDYPYFKQTAGTCSTISLVRPPPKKASANPVINEAFAVDGSANVDAVVVAGEMLNMRHVERQ